MREKIKLFRMLWKVIRKKEKGWVFFRLNLEQQKELLNDRVAELDIEYVNVDKRVVERLANKLAK